MEKNVIFIYVDPAVKESGNGSIDSPFCSIEDAKKIVRDSVLSGLYSEVSVVLRGGVYPPISFAKEDSGCEDCRVVYRSFDGENAVISGGIRLNYADFTPIDESEAEKLYDRSAAPKIVKIDLKKYGLTEADLGTSTSVRADKEGISPELYINGKRMTVARFPNSEWLIIDEILENEDGTIRNACRYSDEVNEHVKFWKYSPKPRAYGYFKHHWSDHDAGFIADTDEKIVKFVELPKEYLEKGRRYYFYALFEELDAAGEYYIDKENGILYLVAPDGLCDSDIILSVSGAPIVSIEEADYITFDSLTLAYTKNKAIEAKCNGLIVNNCRIFGIHSHGVSLYGDNARITNCEVSGTGGCGLFLVGGKVETLEASNILVYNNYIHDFSEIQHTYTPGVELYGCGTTVSHNEISDAPHSAILFHGPLHIIEYNRIINVCNDSSDCGAIYSGRTMFYYGTVVRYNYIKDVGNHDIDDDFFCAQGIYYDDGLSGQIAYGNIIENVTGRGIYVGGGRDNIVCNNVIINPEIYSIDPDDRMRDGAFYDGWFPKKHLENMSNDIQKLLCDRWYEKFPVFKRMKFDYQNGDPNDLDLFVIPANNKVANNVTYKCPLPDGKYEVGKFCFEAICDFSEMHDNYIMNDGDEYIDFADYDSGDRTIKIDSKIRRLIPDFDIIPFDKIGRVGK